MKSPRAALIALVSLALPAAAAPKGYIGQTSSGADWVAYDAKASPQDEAVAAKKLLVGAARVYCRKIKAAGSFGAEKSDCLVVAPAGADAKGANLSVLGTGTAMLSYGETKNQAHSNGTALPDRPVAGQSGVLRVAGYAPISLSLAATQPSGGPVTFTRYTSKPSTGAGTGRGAGRPRSAPRSGSSAPRSDSAATTSPTAGSAAPREADSGAAAPSPSASEGAGAPPETAAAPAPAEESKEEQPGYVAPKTLEEFNKLSEANKRRFCNEREIPKAAAADECKPRFAGGNPKFARTQLEALSKENCAASGVKATSGLTWSGNACIPYLAPGVQQSAGGGNLKTEVPNPGHGDDVEPGAGDKEKSFADKWLNSNLIQLGVRGALVGLVVGSLFNGSVLGIPAIGVGVIAGAALFYGLARYADYKKEKDEKK